MKNELNVLVQLLNDDDEETLQYVSEALLKHGHRASEFLSEEIYLSKNNTHYENIKKVLHHINLKLFTEKLIAYLQDPNDTDIFQIFHELHFLYQENSNFEIAHFENFRTHIIQRSWLFMQNEPNYSQTLAILHCLLMINTNIKHLNDLTMKLGEHGTQNESYVGLNDNNIFKCLKLPLASILQILKESYRLKITGLKVNQDESAFEDFFFSSITQKGKLHYQLYLLLLKNLLNTFAYETSIVRLDPYIVFKTENEPSNYVTIPNVFIKIQNQKNPNLIQLYDIRHHEYANIEAIPYENLSKRNLPTLFTFSENKNKTDGILFSLTTLDNVSLLKNILKKMHTKSPEHFKADFKNMLELFLK